MDILGILLALVVHPADVQDRDGAKLILTKELLEACPELELICGDRGYRGDLAEWMSVETPGLRLEIVQHPDAGGSVVWVKEGEPPPVLTKGFRVLPKRWVVERTFAWLGLNRRLSKDYEATTLSSETWMWMAMARLLACRLSTSK